MIRMPNGVLERTPFEATPKAGPPGPGSGLVRLLEPLQAGPVLAGEVLLGSTGGGAAGDDILGQQLLELIHLLGVLLVDVFGLPDVLG